jgi:hypothetical protein
MLCQMQAVDPEVQKGAAPHQGIKKPPVLLRVPAGTEACFKGKGAWHGVLHC